TSAAPAAWRRARGVSQRSRLRSLRRRRARSRSLRTRWWLPPGARAMRADSRDTGTAAWFPAAEGCVQLRRVAAGEVAARGADIGREQGVADEGGVAGDIGEAVAGVSGRRD